MKAAPKGYLWIGEKGDLSLYLTHIQFNIGDDEEPSLYIRNEHRKTPGGGCPVYLLPLQDLWMFRPEDRDRGKHHKYSEMDRRLGNACVALYGLDVPAYRFRIHDAILEFADDLKNTRPPEGMTGEEFRKQLQRHGVSLKVNGEKVI
jgi:hypothetical protein